MSALPIAAYVRAESAATTTCSVTVSSACGRKRSVAATAAA